MSPYLIAQLVVLGLVLAYPVSVWPGPGGEIPVAPEPAPASSDTSFPFVLPQDDAIQMPPSGGDTR